MKKGFLIIVLAALGFDTIHAQNEEYRDVTSLTAGLSLFNIGGPIVKAALTNAGQNENQLIKTNSIPTLQVSYDHAFGRVFSLGGALSLSQFSAQATNFDWKDAAGNISTGYFNLETTRTTFGMRALFHYGNKGKIDMYSGVRVGVGIWKIKFDSDLTNFTVDKLNGVFARSVSPQVQVIPFALRGYITENIGLGFETAIGSPYMASLSLQYRFGSGSSK